MNALTASASIAEGAMFDTFNVGAFEAILLKWSNKYYSVPWPSLNVRSAACTEVIENKQTP